MDTSDPATDAAYDSVGRYQQDEVNGFSRDLIFSMLEAASPECAESILDAMAGDGNLTRRLAEYCRLHRLAFPAVTVLEFSRVQAEFAKEALASAGASARAKVVWGDVLAMRDLSTGTSFPDSSFDRVLIKSANHELPLARQPDLYRSVFRVLRPGGLFVNLGMLFDDPAERDELREIARVKDTFAGMQAAVVNRYFLLRSELYGFLGDAGFIDVRPARSLEYSIRSSVVAKQYFSADARTKTDLEFQSAQVKAVTLRRHGRVRFEGDATIMTCPGEITVARKPGLARTDAGHGTGHPMDFLRKIRAHQDLLEEAARHIPEGSTLTDLGCGIGLLTEHLAPKVSYRGIDISPEYIGLCKERYAWNPALAFSVAGVAEAALKAGASDAVTILNTLNLPGANAVATLKCAHAALRPGGRLIVSGPTSPDSFARAEPFILAQLDRDGHGSPQDLRIRDLWEAKGRIPTDRGNTWSAEGMVALVRRLGFSSVAAVNKELYYGNAYLVVAVKGDTEGSP